MVIHKPLYEIKQFLNQHPREFVIIDFQHFYDMTSQHHKFLQDIILTNFRKNLIRKDNGNIDKFTLDFCYKLRKQVFIIYRSPYGEHIPELWPGNIWKSPWPNKTKTEALRNYLQKTLQTRNPNSGYVTQCILTPSTKYISSRFTKSLLHCAKKVEKSLQSFILDQKPGRFSKYEKPNVNVFIADFIDINEGQFCKWVISLNYKIVNDVNYNSDEDFF